MNASIISRPADSCALVIFGGNGDLAWRKLVPSLFNLHIDINFPEKMAIIAVDCADIDDAALRKRLRVGVKTFARAGKPQDWRNFGAHLSYCRGDFENSKTYIELASRLAKLDKDWNAKRPTFFTSPCRRRCSARIRKSSPRLASQVIANGLASLSKSRSARKLNRVLTRSFHESQIFRVDHSLGDETVQNILAFQFASLLFEPIWDYSSSFTSRSQSPQSDEGEDKADAVRLVEKMSEFFLMD